MKNRLDLPDVGPSFPFVLSAKRPVGYMPVQRRDRNSNRDERWWLREDVARLVYEEYATCYGIRQSFERMHERGGFGVSEVVGFLARLVMKERGK